MLGKLFRHEWKRAWRMECLFLAVLFAVAILGTVLCFTPITNIFDSRVNPGLYFDGQGGALLTFAILAFFSGIFAGIIVTVGIICANLIYQGVRFAKTMYGDEGYLTHTLPVTVHKLLLGKILVSGLWVLIVQAAAYLCVLVESLAFVASIHEPAALAKLIEDAIADMVRTGNVGWMIHFLAAYGASMLIGPFLLMTTLFGALTIGQLSKKHKGLMGIIVYCGISFGILILQMISQSIGSSLMMWDSDAFDFHVNLFFGADMSLLINLLAAVLLYFLSHYIIEKKLNLN